jgi:hypothetical protein
MGYSLGVFAQTKILEPLHSDPSQERNQKQKGGNQNGSIKKALKVCIPEKPQGIETRDVQAGPKEPRGKNCAQQDGSDEISENLKASAQEEKELAWTLTRRKLKFFTHAQ